MKNNDKIQQTELIKKSSIVIGRVMTKEEFVEVCSLLHLYVGEVSRKLKPRTLAEVAKEFKADYERDEYEVFVAIDKNNENKIVGFVTGEPIQPKYKADSAFFVENLFVIKEYRGSSAMSLLMRAIFKIADKQKLISIVNVFPQDKNKLPTLAKRYADSDTADYLTYYRTPKNKKRG